MRPFELVEKPLSLRYVAKTSQKNIHLLSISEVENQNLKITTDGNLNDQEKNHTLKVVKRMFRLDEDYSEFYVLAEKSKEFSWVDVSEDWYKKEIPW